MTVRWMYAQAQAVGDDGGVHLDLCVDDVAAAAAAAQRLGAAVTGRAPEPGALPEFHRLRPPPGQPLRLLVQRLESAGPVGAHLDLACTDIPATRARHEELGGRFDRAGDSWTVMRDPAGGLYCLTGRDPRTGRT
jgi:hypothetical protein